MTEPRRVPLKVHCRRIYRPHDYRSNKDHKTYMCCVHVSEKRPAVDGPEFLKLPENERCNMCNVVVSGLVRNGRIHLSRKSVLGSDPLSAERDGSAARTIEAITK